MKIIRFFWGFIKRAFVTPVISILILLLILGWTLTGKRDAKLNMLQWADDWSDALGNWADGEDA